MTGTDQDTNGMCILSQNVINEKVYFVLWFWYMFLFHVCAWQLLYRIVPIVIPGIRARLIALKLHKSYDDTTIKRFFKSDFDLGDWFLLNQIGKNVDSYFFEKFLYELFPMTSRGGGNGIQMEYVRASLIEENDAPA